MHLPGIYHVLLILPTVHCFLPAIDGLLPAIYLNLLYLVLCVSSFDHLTRSLLPNNVSSIISPALLLGTTKGPVVSVVQYFLLVSNRYLSNLGNPWQSLAILGNVSKLLLLACVCIY